MSVDDVLGSNLEDCVIALMMYIEVRMIVSWSILLLVEITSFVCG